MLWLINGGDIMMSEHKHSLLDVLDIKDAR
jgi:hypothetical protein